MAAERDDEVVEFMFCWTSNLARTLLGEPTHD